MGNIVFKVGMDFINLPLWEELLQNSTIFPHLPHCLELPAEEENKIWIFELKKNSFLWNNHLHH